MSYQVLARKWRPRTFREMIGQEHVLRALINALDHGRLHHAYLFTGTRGVGKTSIARILAKCLNCETGVSSEPCGECSACVEISEGRFVDLIEVDAASRTKVEDTRELLDNVQYAPTRGRYKIYLIDEVHMLSNHSFNALLKTLEEPPEHVKFLLATTDPQKLPVTILSRCLQFNLKNMSPERIVGHLSHILENEVIPFEESALWQLARSADGSMRDALSLTDQSISFGGGKVSEDEVASMLGTIDHKLVQSLVGALVAGDGSQILTAVAKFAEHAPDFDVALADLITLLHRIAIAQALPDALDNSYGDRTQILEFASKLAPEDVQLFYQTALIGRRDLSLSPDPRSGFEMTLLRMLAFKPQGVADVPTQRLQAQPASTPAAAPVANTEPSANVRPPANTQPSASPAPSVSAEPSTYAQQPENSAPEASTAPPANEAPQQAAPAPAEPAVPAQSHAAEQHVAHDNAPPADYYDNTPPPYEEAQEPVKKPQAEPQAQAALAPANEAQPAPAVNEPTHAPTQPAAQAKTPADALREQVKAIVGKEGLSAQPKAASQVKNVAAPAAAAPFVATPISLEELTPSHWVSVYNQLNVRGILQSTAANTVLIGREDNHLDFALDEQKSSLFDPSHSERLSALLSDYFGVPIKATIHLQNLAGDVETPAGYAIRIDQEKRVAAIQNMYDDPVVQALQQQFNATLVEDTVTYQ